MHRAPTTPVRRIRRRWPAPEIRGAKFESLSVIAVISLARTSGRPRCDSMSPSLKACGGWLTARWKAGMTLPSPPAWRWCQRRKPSEAIWRETRGLFERRALCRLAPLSPWQPEHDADSNRSARRSSARVGGHPARFSWVMRAPERRRARAGMPPPRRSRPAAVRLSLTPTRHAAPRPALGGSFR